ncbi:glutathione S-transferase U18-like [Vigna umbellata]|uniref:glutathione S-transferase U18-like n=1 Tax=Vigna umbellata TaxID=87088 RepID=UPI001F5E46A4|nr:glutathione S-transferase U18-like [Vigna umbellata]
MAKNDLKLLGGWSSPFSLRVQIALDLKGVDYEVIEETFNPKSELLLKSNPVHKKIPVLIHADKPICESAIIVEYIDEVWTHAPSILPQNAYDRANARFWVAYIDDKWLKALRSILMAEENDEERRQSLRKQKKCLRRMEEVMNKGSEGKAFSEETPLDYVILVLDAI